MIYPRKLSSAKPLSDNFAASPTITRFLQPFSMSSPTEDETIRIAAPLVAAEWSSFARVGSLASRRRIDALPNMAKDSAGHTTLPCFSHRAWKKRAVVDSGPTNLWFVVQDGDNLRASSLKIGIRKCGEERSLTPRHSVIYVHVTHLLLNRHFVSDSGAQP